MPVGGWSTSESRCEITGATALGKMLPTLPISERSDGSTAELLRRALGRDSRSLMRDVSCAGADGKRLSRSAISLRTGRGSSEGSPIGGSPGRPWLGPGRPREGNSRDGIPRPIDDSPRLNDGSARLREGNPAVGRLRGGNPTVGRPSEGNSTLGRPSEGNSTLGRPSEGSPAVGRPREGRPVVGRPRLGRRV